MYCTHIHMCNKYRMISGICNRSLVYERHCDMGQTLFEAGAYNLQSIKALHNDKRGNLVALRAVIPNLRHFKPSSQPVSLKKNHVQPVSLKKNPCNSRCNQRDHGNTHTIAIQSSIGALDFSTAESQFMVELQSYTH